VNRPGYGIRHPQLDEVLRISTPAGCAEAEWADGAFHIRSCAYVPLVDLPDEVVNSIRCIVFVDECIVLCENRDGFHHVWPGGRRERGETHAETARREVHEETGWLIDVDAMRPLGWLHHEHLRDVPQRYRDFLQPVYRVTASERAGDDSWTDTEGYEVASRLVRPEEAREILQSQGDSYAIEKPFLDLLMR